jgi:V/A-type H+/Na+-transporting ATPase subunit A
VPLDYHLRYWRSEVIDFVILQQDAFDKTDSSTPMDRQQYMLNLVLDICNTPLEFDSFEEVNPYFKRIINTLKQMNYSDFMSEQFNNILKTN